MSTLEGNVWEGRTAYMEATVHVVLQYHQETMMSVYSYLFLQSKCKYAMIVTLFGVKENEGMSRCVLCIPTVTISFNTVLQKVLTNISNLQTLVTVQLLNWKPHQGKKRAFVTSG